MKDFFDNDFFIETISRNIYIYKFCQSVLVPNPTLTKKIGI